MTQKRIDDITISIISRFVEGSPSCLVLYVDIETIWAGEHFVQDFEILTEGCCKLGASAHKTH